MAIETSIIDYGKGLIISVTGTLLGSQIIDFNRNQLSEDFINFIKYIIVDKTGVRENYISAEEIKVISEIDKSHFISNPNLIKAIIVPNVMIKITSEVWSEFMRPKNDRVGVFDTYINAMNWISHKLGSVHN